MIQSKRQINLRTINKGIGALVVALMIWYVFAVNSLSIAGFALSDYKNRLEDVKRDNKSLEVKINNIRSYAYLTERANQLGLVSVGDISYINPVNIAVAKK
jgi:hypothetical protein